MPSRKKTLMFMAGFFASVGSFALTCTSLGTQDWVSSRVAFLEDTGSNKSFGNVNIDYGLFEGEFQISVVLNYEKEVFQVLQKTSESGGINVVHILVILFLVAGLFCSLASSGVTCYNSVSNPYQTFFGPIGVYTWNGINGILVLLALVLSAVNTEVNKMPTYLARRFLDRDVTFENNQGNTYGYSFWLLLPTVLLNVMTIIIIYFYQHQRYSQQREQQRPLENASKDVILF